MSYTQRFAQYTKTASWMHWLTAIPMMGTIGTVLQAQQAPKKDKGRLMFLHKSFGLLTAMIVLPRFALRIVDRSKYHLKQLEGSGPIQETLASLTHYGLYGFMIFMPATGIAMGYYGGKGLPFFYTTLPGAEKTNGKWAGRAYRWHKQVGIYGKYLVPVHAAAAVQHWARGHAIFTRINPFAVRPPKM